MNIIISIVILLTYTIVMIKIGGSIPPSLSTSVFNLPTNKRWICVEKNNELLNLVSII